MVDRTLKTKDEIFKFINNRETELLAGSFFNFAEVNDLRVELKITAKFYSFWFYPKTSPRALFKMDLNEKTLRIKAQLFFIANHNEDLETLSPSLKEMVKKTPPCTRCSLNCKQGIAFKLDGTDYFTCINEGHYFKDLTAEEASELISLLDKELKVILSLND